MPFPSEHAARQKDPGKYKRFRRENGKLGKGIDVVWGVKEDDSVEIQSIRFDAGKFTIEEAKKWLEEHNFKASVEPAKKKEEPSAQQQMVTVHVGHYQLRDETHLGKPHIVVPIIMLTEGVHHGNYGPILHKEEELAKFPKAWNGIPVVVGHPEEDGQAVSANESPEVMEKETIGRLFNTEFKEGKLRSEAWLDKERITENFPEILEHLQSGRPMEVSTGMFLDNEAVGEDGAKWNGEKYIAVAKNYRPDHLALLLDSEGACSWKDGCGVRTNQKGGGVNVDVRELKRLAVLNGLSTIPFINETSHDQTARAIGSKLGGMDNNLPNNHYLVEVYDDFFIFEVYPKVGSVGVMPNSHAQQQLFKLGYSVGEDGTVEFEGTPVPVVRQVEYVEKKVATFSRTKGVDMDKKEEAGKEVCCLEKLQEMTKKGQEEGKKEVSPVVVANQVSQEQAISVLRQALNDPKQAIVILEGKAREMMEYGVQELVKKKAGLTQQILSANALAFSREELEEKGIAELEKLVALIGQKEEQDYSGINAGGVTTHGRKVELLLPVGI